MDNSQTPIARLHNAVEEVYDWIAELVTDNGGTLDMSDDSGDTAYAMEVSGDDWVENQVTALRVNDERMLEYKTTAHDEWWNLKYSDNYYLPTLMQIADCIEEYLDNE